MTWGELIRLLKKNGCKFDGHRANHDMYFCPKTGEVIAVGRHTKEEVRTGTMRAILKQAGIK